MNPDLEIVKNFAPIATPFISSVVDVWIKPKLKELYQKNKVNKELYENIFGELFEDYLKRTYERNNIMNTVVFQNRPKSISELYIPLTLQLFKDDIEEILIDGTQMDKISKINKIVVTDSAGMGKSTVLKKMFLDCINNNTGVPIFIELRKLSKENRIIDEIFKELNPIHEEFDKDFILNLIKRGNFVFFLDGYDEIPLDERRSVTDDLQSFISKASKNLFILSSRPQTAITSFSNFQEVKIKPLEKEEAFELLRKYDETHTLADTLIDVITEEQNSKNLEEFLINPLMVSLLYKGYEFKQTISYKKSIFYRQVYDALYENHDLTKGGAYVHEKLSGLDIEEFHTVLRAVAFITWKIGKIEYDRDEIIKFLSRAKVYSNIPFKESEFLEDLVGSVPLFYKEGNFYRWKHKSLQEYFSAQYICKDSKNLQEKILLNIYSSKDFSDYLNVLDLCYDIDYKTFRHSIIYKLVCDAIDYNNNRYKYFNEIDTPTLLERKQITFGQVFFIVTNYNILKTTTKDKDEFSAESFLSIHNKATELIKMIYKKIINEYENETSQISTSNSFMIMKFEKINYRILQLLWNKKEKFIGEFTENLPENSDNNDKLNEIFKPSPELEVQIIDDDISKVFNNISYFEATNYVLKKFNDDLNQSYYVKFEMLKEIKKDIENEKELLINDELLIF